MRALLLLLLSASLGWSQPQLFFASGNATKAGSIPQPAAGGGSGVTTNFNDLIVNDLGSSQSTANATSYTATLGQPTTNALVLAMVASTKASAPDIPTLSGNNLTWVLMAVTNNTGTASNQVSVFRAQGNPTNGTLTATFGGTQTGCIIHAWEIQGADTSGANGANAIVQVIATNGTAANPVFTYTASTAAATNMLVACMSDNQNSATGRTAPTNWVMFAQHNYATPNAGAGLMFQPNCTSSNTAVVTATARTWSGIFLEVKPSLESNPATRPQLVQWRALAYETDGKTYVVNLPNQTLAGNLLQVMMVYNQGNPLTITDNKGVNNWTKAISTNEINQNAFTAAIWYQTNTPAGISTITFSFSTNNINIGFTAQISEFANIAPYQPVDAAIGTEGGAGGMTGPVVSPGAMTTTAAGDLVCVFSKSIQAGQVNAANRVTWCGGTGFQFGVPDSALASISQYVVQATNGGLAPSVTINQASADYFVSVAVAYKRGGSGTLRPTNSIHIVREWDTWTATTTPTKVLFSSSGNLIPVITTNPRSTYNIPTLSDTAGNTWTKVAATTYTSSDQCWFASNAVARVVPPNIMSVANASGQSTILKIYDVENAAASPYDTFAENESTQGAAGASVSSMATITPGTSNGLIIDCMGMFVGPPSGLTSPSGGVFGSVYWSGQTDSSTFNSADGYALYYNPNTSAVSFNWTTANASASQCNGLAVAFKGK